MNARKIAQYGVLAAMALALGWAERFLPIAPGIPGIKLGLGNVVLLFALKAMDVKSAVLLMLLKVLLTGFLLSGLSGLLYSLAGGVCSLAVMCALRRCTAIIPISMAGSLAHNAGQALAAMTAIPARAVLAYVPLLAVSGLVTGVLTGIAATYALKGLSGFVNRPGQDPGKREEQA